MKELTEDVILSTILNFLEEINIEVKEQELDDTTLLPGLDVQPNSSIA